MSLEEIKNYMNQVRRDFAERPLTEGQLIIILLNNMRFGLKRQLILKS